MYKRPNKQTSAGEPSRKTVNSRIYLFNRFYDTKEGQHREELGMVSLGNTVLIRKSKRGKPYGRLPISGDYPVKLLKEVGAVPDESGTVWITVFFPEKDIDFISGEPDGKTRRSMVGDVSADDDGGLILNVRAIGW